MPTGDVRRARLAASAEGFMMAALLVAMSVMMIVMAAALPAWQTASRREREAELVFRGQQYARAIAAFQRKYGGANPPSVDVLVSERLLRQKYKDPITNEDFVLITQASELPTTTTIPGIGGALTAGRSTGAATTSARAGGSPSTTSSPASGTPSTAGRGSSTTPARATGLQAGATTGIMGVRSKSTDKSFRVYNGLEHYNEWIFLGTQASSRAGAAGGAQTPGAGTRGGAAGTRGGQPIGGRGGTAPPGGGRGAAPVTPLGGTRSIGPGQ